jgi:hypothetical protein
MNGAIVSTISARAETPVGVRSRGGDNMKAALTAAATTILLAATAGTAQARGDGWEKVAPADPYTSVDCGTTLTVTEVVNREWQRVTTDADGITHIQVTGAYKVLITTEDGRSALVNASGPGFHSLDAAGVFTFDARGLTILGLTPEQAQQLGLPLDAVLSGPFTVRSDPDGTLTLLRAPSHVRSVCGLLK